MTTASDGHNGETGSSGMGTGELMLFTGQAGMLAFVHSMRIGPGSVLFFHYFNVVRFLLRHTHVVCAHLSDGGREAVIVQSHAGSED